VRHQIEDCLERLRADLGGWLALLTHDSGALLALAGPGDAAIMRRYCQGPRRPRCRPDPPADPSGTPMMSQY
jgi:hypothetical protein